MLAIPLKKVGRDQRPVYDFNNQFIGYLSFDSNKGQIDAQCRRTCHNHKGDPKCHIHRVLKKAPLGYLLAWLLHVDCDTIDRNTHMVSRFDRTPDGWFSHLNRLRARAWGEQQAQLQFFFDKELESGCDGSEPIVLPK